jgi:diguanylate cyclase (GGDEF)-like protein
VKREHRQGIGQWLRPNSRRTGLTAREAVMTRHLALVGMLVTAVFFLTWLAHDPAALWPFSLASAFILIAFALVFRRSASPEAAPLIIAVIFAAIIKGIVLFGADAGIHLFSLVTVALASRLLARQHKGFLLVCFLIAGILLAGTPLLLPGERALASLPDFMLTVFYILSAVTTVIIIGTAAYWLHMETDLAEKRLRSLNTQLETLARTDELTGLANRRGLISVLGDEWARGRREETWLAVIMCDVDHFKAFNDSEGHDKGDDCLQAIARILESTVQRPADLVARYGGEEFTVILPGTDLPGAETVAEKLRQAVAGKRIPNPGLPGQECITISAGVTAMRADKLSDPMELIREADHALYEAKDAGRNRVARYTG